MSQHNYDMVYTSNARGQAEKTLFIDSDDSTTRTSTRLYTWRDRIRKVTNPDGNSLDYEWDDHLRMSKEKLQGNDEYYQYDWCICGPIKRHRYHYKDSLNNAQDMDWTNTTDNAGRLLKEYYPYTIAKHGSDEYHSVLYEHDRANRRERMSDPVWGHTCADTSGWGSHIEPSDETNWTFDTPTHYRYGMQGNVEAMGRVAGGGIVAGQGEPYFVQRDALGRASQVTYPDSGGQPEYIYTYDYEDDGRLKQTALVSTKTASSGSYGPEKYVVQFQHDAMGRVVRKVVRDNTASDATRFEFTYEFDGRGHQTREKIMAWDASAERMLVKQDIRTTYDLGDNPTEVRFYDNDGLAYKETRSYARGYQLTGASFSDLGSGVAVTTHGSYTYDTNNNMTGTMKVDATRSGAQLDYRGEWTFAYDRKKRLITHTNTKAGGIRGNIWYDGLGRVWQRWNYDTGLSAWASTLIRNVYDGSSLVQEHTFSAVRNGTWTYTYSDISRDYLRTPSAVRQREGGVSSYVDHFLHANQASLEFKIKRNDAMATVARTDRSASLNQFSGATFGDISHLAAGAAYIESYGGGTTGSSGGFDPLTDEAGRPFIAGLSRFGCRKGNNPYADKITGKVDTSNWTPLQWFLWECGQAGSAMVGLMPYGTSSGFIWIPTPDFPTPPYNPPKLGFDAVYCCCYLEDKRWMTTTNLSFTLGIIVVSLCGCSCSYGCDGLLSARHYHREWKWACPEQSLLPIGYENSLCCKVYITDEWFNELYTAYYPISQAGDSEKYSITGKPCTEVCKDGLNYYSECGYNPDLWSFFYRCANSAYSEHGYRLAPCPPKGDLPNF